MYEHLITIASESPRTKPHPQREKEVVTRGSPRTDLKRLAFADGCGWLRWGSGARLHFRWYSAVLPKKLGERMENRILSVALGGGGWHRRRWRVCVWYAVRSRRVVEVSCPGASVPVPEPCLSVPGAGWLPCKPAPWRPPLQTPTKLFSAAARSSPQQPMPEAGWQAGNVASRKPQTRTRADTG